MGKKPYIADEKANLISCRDPMALVVGDTYYITASQPPFWWEGANGGKSEGVNPGVHLWSTKDFVHFADHGDIIRREDIPEDKWYRDRFWAPELFDGKDGWYYLTFNCRNESREYLHVHSVGLARAKEITGPYEVLTQEAPLTEGYGFANDASLFRDEDGTLYLAANISEALRIWKLDTEKVAISDEIEVCDIGKEGQWDSIGVEGPCIVKRHGMYFQWYSSWTYGYASGILTADTIRGPWKKHPDNPILKENDIWHLCGHNHSFTGLDGKDYIIFHAFPRDPAEEQMERMFVRRVEYFPDGSVKIYPELGYGE